MSPYYKILKIKNKKIYKFFNEKNNIKKSILNIKKFAGYRPLHLSRQM
jgi:hypothetical protein